MEIGVNAATHLHTRLPLGVALLLAISAMGVYTYGSYLKKKAEAEKAEQEFVRFPVHRTHTHTQSLRTVTAARNIKLPAGPRRHG